MSDRNGPLRTRVLKGLSWSLLQTWGTHLVTFIVFLVTARLLGPDAFGTVVIAYTVLGALTMVMDLGMGDALIRARDVMAATFDRDLLLLLGKVLVVEARRSAWDLQPVAVRSALIVAAIVALALAGGLVGLALAAAAIAAPLWLVFGSGFVWLVALREELLRLVPPDVDENHVL